jgi:hypothetical protein
LPLSPDKSRRIEPVIVEVFDFFGSLKGKNKQSFGEFVRVRIIECERSILGYNHKMPSIDLHAFHAIPADFRKFDAYRHGLESPTFFDLQGSS